MFDEFALDQTRHRVDVTLAQRDEDGPLGTGATGNVGGRVLSRLIGRGVRPRVFVRDPAKLRARFGDGLELAVGNLDDASSLTAALDGIDRLFLLNDGSTLARRDSLAAEAARRSGVKRIVKLSALGARARIEPSAVARLHADGEAAIRASGVPFSFVQPVGFMSNALEARAIKRRASCAHRPAPVGSR